MKSLFIFIFSFAVIRSFVWAQAPAIEWQRSLGGSESDEALAVCQTSEGGYIVTGRSMSPNGQVGVNRGSADGWIVKLNILGFIQWQISLGGSGWDEIYSVKQTADGGFIAAGATSSPDGDIPLNRGASDVWLIRLDEEGNVQWQKTYGGTAMDEAYGIEQTADGGYIFCGTTISDDMDVSGNHGHMDCWIVKTDSEGEIEWQSCFGGSLEDRAYGVKPAPDGGFIAAGFTASSDQDVEGNHGFGDYWILKLDDQGTLIWQQCLGGSGNDIAYDVIVTEDGGYAVAGASGSNDEMVSGNQGDVDFWMVKLSDEGYVQWQKCFGGTNFDYATSIHQLPDGDYAIAGYTGGSGGDVSDYRGGVDYWILRCNASGDLVWQKCLGGNTSDYAFASDCTQDGGFVIAGWSVSNTVDVTGNNGGRDFWVVKLEGETSEVPVHKSLLPMVYPNPADEKLYFECAGLTPVSMINSLGIVVWSGVLPSGIHEMDVRHLAPGIYFIQVDGHFPLKWIKR